MSSRIRESIDRLVEQLGERPLQILREVERAHFHIPDEAIGLLAEKLQIPRSQVQGLAEFYSFLNTKPAGKYRVHFSDSITDRMLGKEALIRQLLQKLGAERGKMRADGRVSVSDTSCTGMCDQGPALLVNSMAITRLSAERIDRIAELIESETALDDWPREFFSVEANIRRRDLLLSEAIAPGAALKVALDSPDSALSQIEISGLRGRGGAGFSTASKWRFCRGAASDSRYVVCNADEGEPGTFKDRVLLQHYADQVFEGMTLCGAIVGAAQGYLYIRDEYSYLKPHLDGVLESRRKQGLLGKSISGGNFDFDIEIHWGAGAYVCGEESALIESLEGKRGIPRIRPPFPVTSGLFGKPTTVNNVETFFAAAAVTVNGGDWFAAQGSEKSRGTKLFSVSGDCERPGIYEYPMGTPILEVLRDCGAMEPQAVQCGGPSGTCIGASEFDRRLCFEDLPPGGALMVFDRSRNMVDVAENFASFFAHESCGFCTPCRVGTSLLKEIMQRMKSGNGSHADFSEIEHLGGLLKMSHCGLGQGAVRHLLDMLAKFPDSFAAKLAVRQDEPAFDLNGALAVAREHYRGHQ